MAWRDALKTTASFRGVPFFVDVAHREGGRKLVTHEYPYRDVAFSEDLGRRPRVHKIDGYVLGLEYMAARDRLLEALEAEGPGELVHPYHGRLKLHVRDFSFEDRRDAGGYGAFSMEFIESPDDPFAPAVANAPAAVVPPAVLQAHTVSRQVYARIYATTAPTLTPLRNVTTGRSLPGFAFTSIIGVVQSATGVVASARTGLFHALAPVIKGTQALATLKRSLDTLYLTASSLVRDPIRLAGGFSDVLRSLVDVPPRLGVSALLQAYQFTPSHLRPAAITPIRQIEQRNYDATLGLVRQLIAVQAADFAAAAAVAPAGSGYDSYEDAIATRDLVMAALDEQAAIADDEVFDTIKQVRADLALAVPGESQPPARLLPCTPLTTIPSLVLAHQLYGSIDLADDLVARNHVQHPAFLVGGRTLQVLARG